MRQKFIDSLVDVTSFRFRKGQKWNNAILVPSRYLIHKLGNVLQTSDFIKLKKKLWSSGLVYAKKVAKNLQVFLFYIRVYGLHSHPRAQVRLESSRAEFGILNG